MYTNNYTFSFQEEVEEESSSSEFAEDCKGSKDIGYEVKVLTSWPSLVEEEEV